MLLRHYKDRETSVATFCPSTQNLSPGCQPEPTLFRLAPHLGLSTLVLSTMQHYGHSLQPQGTKAGARTMDVVYPFFPHGNPMGMPRGHYPVAVGGFRCIMSGRMMRRCNVQGAVKCSGWNPNEKAYQKPNLDEVANLPDGSRIPVVYLPIMHRDFWKGAEPMIDFLRKIWLQGGTIFFFDDLGKDR